MPPSERCGQCSACLTVEMTKRIVLASSAPAGPGITDREASLWNTVLADNPCNGDPSTGDAIRVRQQQLRERRHAQMTREMRQRIRENQAVLVFGE